MPSRDKYTDPELRDQVKEEVQDGDKGGAPGQWSARKAQFMAQEYKKRGGGYTTDKEHKDESQRHLDGWGEEEWQTKEGSGRAKKDDGTEKRYLPKKAWEKMTKEEKEETDRKKQEGSREGKQYVENTDEAKRSRKTASKSGEGQVQDDGKKDAPQQKNPKQGANRQNGDDRDGHDNHDEDDDDAAATEDDGEAEYVDDGQADTDKDGDVEMDDEEGVPEREDEDDAEEEDEEEEEEEENDGIDDDHDDENVQTGQKRKGDNEHHTNGTSKKQKDNRGGGNRKETVGSKHMDAKEPAPRGSKEKLPKKGQNATWKAMPGYVEGEVVDVLTENQEVEGKSTKASKDDPKIVLKSDKSGKICVHKPDSCFYYI